MPISDQKKTQFHPTQRNKVLASADVCIRQVQLVDKKGAIRSVIVWQCGPDMFYSNTMDGMFDVAQRRKAPEWLVEAIAQLPSDKQFSYDGTPKSTAPASKSYLPDDDGDLPEFAQG